MVFAPTVIVSDANANEIYGYGSGAYGPGAPKGLFTSKAGNRYLVTVKRDNSDPANPSFLSIWKLGFGEQDAANAPAVMVATSLAHGSDTGISGYGVAQVGDVLQIVYFPDGFARNASPPTIKSFSMTSDTWGAAVQSTLANYTVNFPVSGGGILGRASVDVVAVYNQARNAIGVFMNNNGIVGTDTNLYLRGSFAEYNLTTGWDAAYLVLGGPSSSLNDWGMYSAGATAGGRYCITFTVWTSVNGGFAGYQQIRENKMLAPAQVISTVSTTTGALPSMGWALLTLTEILFPFGSNPDGSGLWRTLNVARAPLSGEAPAWTLNQIDNVAPATISDFLLTCSSGTPYALYTAYTAAGLTLPITLKAANLANSQVGVSPAPALDSVMDLGPPGFALPARIGYWPMNGSIDTLGSGGESQNAMFSAAPVVPGSCGSSGPGTFHGPGIQLVPFPIKPCLNPCCEPVVHELAHCVRPSKDARMYVPVKGPLLDWRSC